MYTMLAERLPSQVTRSQQVADLTTYRLGGPVAIAVRVETEADLQVVAAAVAPVVAAAGAEPALPTLVIGRGSNLLVADAGFAGLAVILAGEFEAVSVDADAATVHAGAAVPLPVLARRAAAAGITGLEFFVGIPGSVGGAVRMNAGGHGAETGDVLVRAWVCPLAGADAGVPVPRNIAELALGYRHSNVGATDVVTRAELRGATDTPDGCTARIEEIVRWRREHQPGGANAGSVFRNPPGDSAGRLIDEAGGKGVRVGGAFVSPKHANFFQADAGATADDVYRLMREVQRRVLEHSGVCLHPELHLVGFPSTDPGSGS